jgi:hypothetical protein
MLSCSPEVFDLLAMNLDARVKSYRDPVQPDHLV